MSALSFSPLRKTIALANWTSQPQNISPRDRRLGRQVTVTKVGKKTAMRRATAARGSVAVKLPPLSMVLVEAARDHL